MANETWSTFSFTESLNPPDGWRTDCAILSTYSADLIVVVTTLLALSGCDLDSRRTGSRVELVKAVEALRGRVRVVAQAGRLTIPGTLRPILKLLDKFVRTIDADENVNSWHPKMALVRYCNVEDATDHQWRVWLGSRNLTRALNWETGLVLASRSDGKGRRVAGMADVAEALAARANLEMFPANQLGAELANLTWECPPGSEVRHVTLLGPGLPKGFPKPPVDTERVFVVSPFLDAKTVHAASQWGGPKTRRALVSTTSELQRLFNQDDKVFGGFADIRIQPLPDLPAEYADTRDEEVDAAPEPVESEDLEPTGLHAKIFLASKGTRGQLWLGSANATERGWQGRNFEIVAELSIARDTVDGIEEFVATCERFTPGNTPPAPDADEEALEQARKLLSAQWSLRQRIGEDELELIVSASPPVVDPTIDLEVAALGGPWSKWPRDAHRILLPNLHRWQRSDFVQVRVSRGDRVCAWLQIAPCDPPPDDARDRALIAQYLDPQTFLLWLRSMLADEPARSAGGDWDAEAPLRGIAAGYDSRLADIGVMPTVEEILRSWARDSSGFAAADEKVKAYLGELERRAHESGAVADVTFLKAFRQTWDTLALELR
jgi:hypothetical protein